MAIDISKLIVLHFISQFATKQNKSATTYLHISRKEFFCIAIVINISSWLPKQMFDDVCKVSIRLIRKTLVFSADGKALKTSLLGGII